MVAGAMSAFDRGSSGGQSKSKLLFGIQLLRRGGGGRCLGGSGDELNGGWRGDHLILWLDCSSLSHDWSWYWPGAMWRINMEEACLVLLPPLLFLLFTTITSITTCMEGRKRVKS